MEHIGKMDRQGRIVLPKELRDFLKWPLGSRLRMIAEANRVTITRVIE